MGSLDVKYPPYISCHIFPMSVKDSQVCQTEMGFFFPPSLPSEQMDGDPGFKIPGPWNTFLSVSKSSPPPPQQSLKS